MSLFSKSREYDKEKRAAKRASNQMSEKRTENQMRLKLGEILETYLRNNDRVAVEINSKYVSLFLSIVQTSFANDYDYEQVTPEMYIFSAKAIDW